MSGPTRDDFEKAIDEYWHDRPSASLEDVLALYGVLAVAESGGSLYGTPSKLEPFVDDGRLVVINVDLAGETPVVDDIHVQTLRSNKVSALAYAHKDSGQGSKYSLTQIGSKSGNTASGVVDTQYGPLGKLAGWPTQDSIEKLTENEGHPDGWVIKALATVFEKKSESLRSVASQIESLLSSDDSVPTVVTVRCKIDGAQLEKSNIEETGWFWPADLDVFDVAMRRYSTANAADKNIDSGPVSEGQAVGLVTGEEGRVVGTPESPLGIFSVKHPDAQPGLRRDQSWRNYPVSEDVAMLFSKGQELIERCAFRRGGMETYAIPYFAGELTVMKSETLYRAVQSLDPDSDHSDSSNAPMARVTFDIWDSDDEEVKKLAESELRFYTVTMPISDDKNIIAEEPAATTHWVSELADALVNTVRGPTLNVETGGFAPYDNWDLLDFRAEDSPAQRDAFQKIVGHEFTDSAFAYRDEEGDDFRRIVDHRLISGVPLDASMLFDEYMRRFGDEFEGDESISHQVVAQQLVHLESLSRADLLSGTDIPIEPTTTNTMIQDITEADVDRSNIGAIREYRLDSFLKRPLFDDAERRASALSGVLVGQLSWHQEHQRDIGRPLDSKTRGDQLTKNGLEQAVKTALEKAKVYALDSEEEYDRDVLFPETVDRLLNATDAMPTDWDIEKREMQFTYVLGQAHGRRSMPNAFELQETADNSVDEPAEATAE
jgi:CRISPR-associated protein Cas8b/Csh1 subtype I-B